MQQLHKLENSYQPMPIYDDQAQYNFSLNKKSAVKYKMDLNLYCIKRPQQTCFVRVTNPNLLAWGIEQGDILIVEKREQIAIGDIIVVDMDGDLAFYEFFAEQDGKKIFFSLDLQNKNITISNTNEVNLLGVVTSSIHQVKPRKAA